MYVEFVLFSVDRSEWKVDDRVYTSKLHTVPREHKPVSRKELEIIFQLGVLKKLNILDWEFPSLIQQKMEHSD